MPTPPDHAFDAALVALLRRGLEQEASDLHLVSGYPPTLRIHGLLQAENDRTLDAETTARMITSIMPPQLRDRLEQQKDFDFSLSLPEPARDGAAVDPARFRVNVFFNQQYMSCATRYFIK